MQTRRRYYVDDILSPVMHGCGRYFHGGGYSPLCEI